LSFDAIEIVNNLSLSNRLDMSRYQPRIYINNPEKSVPTSVAEQFFLTLKTGDLDRIRDYIVENKIKLNIIEPSGKEGDVPHVGETPIHIILQLDNRIADPDTKLRIIKYLYQMGAPLETPNKESIWPLHLAADLQDEDIVDFMLSKNVVLNRTDTSNNTPLHHAVYGKQTPCPKPASLGSIVPSQPIEKQSLNIPLDETNRSIIKILGTENTINNDLIHIINTIMRIPEMYIGDTYGRELQRDVANVFAEQALSSSYTGGLTVTQSQLERLIDTVSKKINDEIVRGLTNPLDIAANNGGWGPLNWPVGVQGPPGIQVEPTFEERIFKETIESRLNNIENNYNLQKNKALDLTKIPIDNLVKTIIPNLINRLDSEYINLLIFCPDCVQRTDYGEEVALRKMLYLLIFNYMNTNVNENDPEWRINRYVNLFMSKKLMNKTHYEQFGPTGTKKQIFSYPDFLMYSSLPYLIRNIPKQLRTNSDRFILKILDTDTTNPPTFYKDCIRVRLNNLITSKKLSDPNQLIDIPIGVLDKFGNQPLNTLLPTLSPDLVTEYRNVDSIYTRT
jgi:hypothetical protein